MKDNIYTGTELNHLNKQSETVTYHFQKIFKAIFSKSKMYIYILIN